MHLRPGAAALAAAACLAGTGAASAPTAVGPEARTIFLSGHSLLDHPLPDDLAALLEASGVAIIWDRQHGAGSSLRERVEGAGTDRDGRPTGPDGGLAGRAYDTLIVTEQHVLPAVLLWNDTVRQLRRLHDRLAAGHPQAVTYFYTPWMALDDKGDPRRWIAYERAAAPIWHCVAAAAGSDLAAKGRRDRIETVPAALALAELIARVTEGAGLPGFTGASVRETVELLVADDVHPTRLGSYYLALVVYVAITGRSPVGLRVPDDLAPERARALQDYVAQGLPEAALPDPDTCAAQLRAGGLDALWDYVERAHGRPEHGFLRAHWARLRQAVQRRWLLWRQPDWNPFRPTG
ncbi:hypothetical protein [Methylorubrum salsuginis]|nr:hypothetical protein [Methylorubrum salsuginis]